MKIRTIGEALQYVADNPHTTADPVDTPVWELVGHALYRVANSPDKRVRGSFGRATRAQKMILDRLVGRRRPGTHPVAAGTDEIEFVDLTIGILPPAEEKPSE